MNSVQFDAKQIFLDALEYAAAAERQAFIARACSGDAVLLGRVEALLSAHQEAGEFLGGAWKTDPEAGAWLGELAGSTVGPYKLLEQIGSGGMGVVYMARQSEPVERLVALKIIKPGMDSQQVIARFEAERQALARMDHPSIARVLDAGTTATGLPYFVMDLVKGVPITQYCDEQRLAIRQRIELVVAVCQAVQHAHLKGIIHRDLKPSNVLVAEYDGRPAPRIIDFGVAKATGEQLTDRTIFTRFGQIVGTFEYMSPEQSRFNQLDVDTRSDIYSLGVLLYELLAGTTPVDKQRLETASFDETLRIIRDEDPPPPSTRVASSRQRESIASCRRAEPARLGPVMRGELDWIVMKALEKDRDRRYETASALAADLMHYLHDEPVSAGPRSRWYRAAKFVRRNRAGVIAAAAVVAGLIAAITGTTIALVSQSRQRVAAERERVQAQLNLAAAHESQFKYADAEQLYRQALEAPDTTTEDQQRAAQTLLRLGAVVRDVRETERIYRKAIAAYRKAYPPNDANTAHALTQLALLLRDRQRIAEAEPMFREAYEIHRQATPHDSFATGASATLLGHALAALGRLDEAEPMLREGVAEYQRSRTPSGYSIAHARFSLANCLLGLGRFREAETEYLGAMPALETRAEFYFVALGLAALYTQWNLAEPDQGFDAKASEWEKRMVQRFVGEASGAKSKAAAAGRKSESQGVTAQAE